MSDLFPHDQLPIPTVPDLSDQIEPTTELIGRGGYGSVYNLKGRWLAAAANTTPKIIAIKIIDQVVNVLINNRCEACLCDFGLSRFLIDNTLWKTTATSAGGTARWMAPEMLDGDASTPTKESDIYAYAKTCYVRMLHLTLIRVFDAVFRKSCLEMYLLNQSQTRWLFYSRSRRGGRPDRMESFHSDFMWDIIARCWEQEPNDRPSTGIVLRLLREKVDQKQIEESPAKIGEKDVALAKVEREMAVLKEEMAEALAKAEEDMKALRP
ncbi:hypothetical protein M378DRAFT_24878 [Amanita muscaria Koide BX008]|uniref:Protein kinase domain-containing protein n=1 Tax=Amanita muscaria (strain Koide BX008) TaxID=946122 RepID=A0A0C2WQ82_AMAMK|nr:hypothetical protein M378DRAFT_24878 [Amanita muscaria Koide BX008]